METVTDGAEPSAFFRGGGIGRGAGELWAFETKPSGGKIVSHSGSGKFRGAASFPVVPDAGAGSVALAGLVAGL
jgi:hypothetical protein